MQRSATIVRPNHSATDSNPMMSFVLTIVLRVGPTSMLSLWDGSSNAYRGGCIKL